MAEVRLQEGESLENALRRFKRKVMTEDIIKDVKRHSYYLKPGERRRVKQALAQNVPEKRFVRTRIKSHQGGPLLPSSGMSALTRQNQDRCRLRSEARAAPPLMSGTMTNSSTVTSESSTLYSSTSRAEFGGLKFHCWRTIS